jgi:acyl dehydratase
MRYFEDVEVGETHEFGEYEVTEEEVVEFAEQYDPQPFHVDGEAAEESMFGELVASGWHTAAMSMRLLVEGPDGMEDRAAMGSPGVEELRWHQPVKPGDTLSVRTEVLEKRPSESREDRGYVKSRLETYNEDGDLVMSWVADTIYRRRDDDG